MGNWLVQRRLKQNGSRLKTLREDLRVIDEQMSYLSEEADDMNIRSLVDDTGGSAAESRQARESADAMGRHRAHVISTIAELERRQDELLDRLVG
ncbi:MAG: hypothetical protein ABIR32_08275 [Ilumatobacteraceae bacterium]